MSYANLTELGTAIRSDINEVKTHVSTQVTSVITEVKAHVSSEISTGLKALHTVLQGMNTALPGALASGESVLNSVLPGPVAAIAPGIEDKINPVLERIATAVVDAQGALAEAVGKAAEVPPTPTTTITADTLDGTVTSPDGVSVSLSKMSPDSSGTATPVTEGPSIQAQLASLALTVSVLAANLKSLEDRIGTQVVSDDRTIEQRVSDLETLSVKAIDLESTVGTMAVTLSGLSVKVKGISTYHAALQKVARALPPENSPEASPPQGVSPKNSTAPSS